MIENVHNAYFKQHNFAKFIVHIILMLIPLLSKTTHVHLDTHLQQTKKTAHELDIVLSSQ